MENKLETKNQTADLAFANPPIYEVAFGFSFESVAGFSNAHLGAFWKSLDQDIWGTLVDAPPLENAIEKFEADSNWIRNVGLRINQDPSARLQIISKQQDRMIQIQNGRFHFNWRAGETPNAQYPGFDQINEEFCGVRKQFEKFLDTEFQHKVNPVQWELVYVDRIPRGELWEKIGEWKFCSLFGEIPSGNSLLNPESFSGNWVFEIPDKQGRLYISWEHHRQETNEPRTEFIQLKFVARGPLVEQSVEKGICLGHSVIIETFDKIMNDEAKSVWGLE